MKNIDSFNNKLVSAFLTAGSLHLLQFADSDVKLMLLHETRNDDGIRSFFNDVWEIYTKSLLNPFYKVDMLIKSPVFETKVKAIAKVPQSRKANSSDIYRYIASCILQRLLTTNVSKFVSMI